MIGLGIPLQSLPDSVSLSFLSCRAETPVPSQAGRGPGKTSASARAPAQRGGSIGAVSPSPPALLGLTLYHRCRARIGFLFPELGCLRRHLALSANPERSVQLLSVIYLHAWPVLPGAWRSIHFRSSRRL